MSGRDGAGLFLIPTGRLLLRPASLDDMDALHRIWTDPEVRRFFWDGEVISRERAEAAVLEGGEAFAKHGFGLWVATEEAGSLVGFCGLRHLDYAPGVELLYGFAPSHWGLGLATEAAVAVLRYGFEEGGLDRIIGIADRDNRASRRVLEKIGMTFEGETLHEGRAEARYSIAREEWPPPATPAWA